MEKVSGIVIHEHGTPASVARFEQLELPAPGVGEARVKMRFAPINPADLNVLEGKYPVRPELPGVPGVEGVGVVEALGPDTDGPAPGTPVLLPHRFGSWREAGNARVEDLVPVPLEIPLEQAAMLRINPATALLMLREFVTLPKGGWVAQNAANSAVGRCVIRIAKHFGWRTINVVRRPEVVDELRALGGDVVLVESEKGKEEIRAALKGESLHLALNSVGGDSATRLAGALAPGGVIVTFGAMSRQPLRIPNAMLIFGEVVWRGFWVTKWYERATAEQRAAFFAELFTLASHGATDVPVDAIYPLSEIGKALDHAMKPMRGGKVLLRG